MAVGVRVSVVLESEFCELLLSCCLCVGVGYRYSPWGPWVDNSGWLGFMTSLDCRPRDPVGVPGRRTSS